MKNSESHGQGTYGYSRITEAAVKVAKLSSVPCDCWAELAAEAVHLLVPASVVRVTVADFKRGGAIDYMFCQEMYVPSSVRERYPSFKLQRATKIDSLNWWIASDKPVVAMLGGLATNEKWLSSEAGKYWAGCEAHTMLACLGKVEAGSAERHIAIELVMPSAVTAPQAADVAALRAVFPFIVDRCTAAFGDEFVSMVTSREVEVLILLANGLSVKEIATHLDRSEHTIHDHVKSLHKKLHASNRGELIARALGYDEKDYTPEGKELTGASTDYPMLKTTAHNDVVVVLPGQQSAAG